MSIIKRKQYSGEFKQKVLEIMIQENMSYHETARYFQLSDHKMVSRWERIYLAEGVEGLYVEKRGRSNSLNGTKKGRPTKFPQKVEEDLLDEVQRLRAEIAYLKKLNALVLKEEHQNKNLK